MRFVVLFLLLTVCKSAVCQFSISGRVLEEKGRAPVEYASVVIAERELWAVTDQKGAFTIKNVAAGEVKIAVSCLGFAKRTFTLKVTKSVEGLEYLLPEDNLALEEVVVTAKAGSEAASTSYTIDRKGLDHLQMLDVADALSLLPGGQTNRATHLASSSPQRIAIRGGTGEQGNATFGTAVEVDGVRLSSNAAFGSGTSGEVYGVDTRSIATHNIASVEIVTGIPSVEYGDLTNGVVRINSRRGKSPLNVELSTKPNTKQASVSKGFDMPYNGGVLNASAEYTRSVSDLASPYTSYVRNTASLIYEKTLRINSQPLNLTAGLSGNIGGYDNRADPDAFRETFLKQKDNTVRANLRLDYLLAKPWITNIELSANAIYSDNLTTENVNKSSSSSVTSIHGTEEGYFVAQRYADAPDAPIVMLPAGYWYELSYIDSKPLTVNARLKAKWSRKFNALLNSNLMLGVDYSATGNRGRGVYYDDMQYAPTWREYRYDEQPFMNNLSLYAEENLTAALGGGMALKLTAGVREDLTMVKGSEYGTVSSLSPRFNLRIAKSGFALHAGWGKAVKLPSFAILYPQPSYSDKLAFAPGTMADGSTFYAYHIQPYKPEYNASLRWQSSSQAELGFEGRWRGISLMLTLYRNRIANAYSSMTQYTPFAYKLTDPKMLDGSAIPSADRKYLIDRLTGVVTVTDRTGQRPDETLDYHEMRTFKSNSTYINGTPSTQSGLDWTLDFGKIQAVSTSVRFDGSYYHYRGTDETLSQYSPVSQMMADGNPYKYVGIYVGGSSSANGRDTKQVNSNLTLTTHIPAIRLLFTLRIETTLLNRTLNLSEYDGAARGFPLDARDDYFATAATTEIYDNDRYVGLYPLYYVSYDDMNTRIPFAEKFAWARDNDRTLYNELAKLVVKSNTDYYFNTNSLSPYYSANINITQEIGKYASISFNARNFLNNMQLVRSSATGFKVTVYESSYIPRFYYGLSLTLKL
jgi:outer membrane cobalamin receptor